MKTGPKLYPNCPVSNKSLTYFYSQSSNVIMYPVLKAKHINHTVCTVVMYHLNVNNIVPNQFVKISILLTNKRFIIIIIIIIKKIFSFLCSDFKLNVTGRMSSKIIFVWIPVYETRAVHTHSFFEDPDPTVFQCGSGYDSFLMRIRIQL